MNQVLIIAKNPQIREQLLHVVRESGVTADVAEEFDPALAQIAKEPPMLVLSENPADDAVMEKLRATMDKHAPVTPMILYLPERDSRLAIKRMAEGAFDCLCPPMTPGDFLAAGKRSVSRMGRQLVSTQSLTPPAWWRRTTFLMTAGFMMFLVLLAMGLFGLWTPPFQLYKLASDHPVAVSGGDHDIWVGDWSQQNLTCLQVRGDYLSIVDVHKFADFQPVAAVVAPYYVFTASVDGRLRRHRREAGLPVTASVPAPGSAPSGLAWDGESLWLSDSESGKIFQLDSRLSVKDSFKSPADKPVGLAWYKDRLWVADGDRNALWSLARQGALWERRGPYSLEIFAHNKSLKLSGFTIWHNKIWFVSEGDGVLVRHRLPEEN
jgi:hypothetical protein